MSKAVHASSKLPEQLSSYWLVKELRTGETAGVMKYTNPPGIIESETGVWLLQVSVRGIDDPNYIVKVRAELEIFDGGSEDECLGWVDRYYLEAITESEGQTYVAMKMKFFDAG